MKLSIIIPTYNIEKYIKECIYSCYNQQGVSTDDYEIIVVNDGSTDRSLNVVEEAQHEIPNLRIVSRPNGGLSAARNTGLDCAKGEFVWFVDGDDCIETNALSILFKAFQQHDCDAYIINYSTFTRYGVEKKTSFNLPKNEFSSRHLMEAENRLLPESFPASPPILSWRVSTKLAVSPVLPTDSPNRYFSYEQFLPSRFPSRFSRQQYSSI